MPTRSKALAATIFLLALVATGVAGYLTWTTWNSTAVVGCTGDAGLDCDSVLSSQWAKWLGVPVSLFGCFTYLLIAMTSWPAAMRKPRLAPTLLFALSLLAAGSGLWFIGLQVLVVKSFCVYCLAVHSCGLVIVVLTLLLVVGTQEERELGYWMTGDGELMDEGLGL
ncbi:MAG: vitamin K epoxide reductase family protein, partial [Lacipirellulaceae bacterium]